MIGALLLGWLWSPAIVVGADLCGSTEAPHIVLILLDAARADHFSSWGYSRPTTPQIDKIAKRGAKFLRYFSNASGTWEAVPRLLSSRYFSRRVFHINQEFGVPEARPEDLLDNFDPEQKLLPEILSRCGYRTALFTQHLGMLPPNELTRWIDFVRVAQRHGPSDQSFIQEAARWFLQATQGGPSFLYVHLMLPHEPYERYPCELNGSLSYTIGPATLARVFDKLEADQPKTKSADGWTSDELKALTALYDDNLLCGDKLVGELEASIRRGGRADKTIMVVTSDHGENLGQHGNLGHGGPPYASITHVPLILVYPPKVPTGVAVHGLSEGVDMVPTLLDLAGIRPHSVSFDGISLRPFLKDPNASKDAVLTQFNLRNSSYSFFMEGRELFDLRVDPNETTTIADQLPVLENLHRLYTTRIRPHEDRFTRSKSTTPLAIQIPILAKDVRNPGMLHYENSTSSMAKRSSQPWVLRPDMVASTANGLRRCAEIGAEAPLGISIDQIPNGRYQVALFAQAWQGPLPNWRAMRLQFRFDQNGPFQGIQGVETVYRFGKAIPMKDAQYLKLGETTIRDWKINFELKDSQGHSCPVKIA